MIEEIDKRITFFNRIKRKIYYIFTKKTPLYNFIDDSYFAKMLVLRHL